jgi:ABC-type glutathione transport system ATPase component
MKTGAELQVPLEGLVDAFAVAGGEQVEQQTPGASRRRNVVASSPQRAVNPRPQRPTIIELAGVEKTYRSGRVGFRALSGVDLAIAAGEMVAVTGPSGSGKTTIINLIAGIDRPTAGAAAVSTR